MTPTLIVAIISKYRLTQFYKENYFTCVSIRQAKLNVVTLIYGKLPSTWQREDQHCCTSSISSCLCSYCNYLINSSIFRCYNNYMSRIYRFFNYRDAVRKIVVTISCITTEYRSSYSIFAFTLYLVFLEYITSNVQLRIYRFTLAKVLQIIQDMTKNL